MLSFKISICMYVLLLVKTDSDVNEFLRTDEVGFCNLSIDHLIVIKDTKLEFEINEKVFFFFLLEISFCSLGFS